MDSHTVDQDPLPQSVLSAVFDVWSTASAQHAIPITGTSMLPFIRNGDRVWIAHGWKGLQRGDLVVFRRKGRLVVHRLMRVRRGDKGPEFITKGDSIPQCDPPLSIEQIVGRVLAVERDGQHMSVDTPTWRTLGRVMALALLTWAELRGCLRDLKTRWVGPQPSRMTTFLRRNEQASISWILGVVEKVFCQWKA